jgi:ribosomal protein L37E
MIILESMKFVDDKAFAHGQLAARYLVTLDSKQGGALTVCRRPGFACQFFQAHSDEQCGFGRSGMIRDHRRVRCVSTKNVASVNFISRTA